MFGTNFCNLRSQMIMSWANSLSDKRLEFHPFWMSIRHTWVMRPGSLVGETPTAVQRDFPMSRRVVCILWLEETGLFWS